jgi:hypothetical protein
MIIQKKLHDRLKALALVSPKAQETLKKLTAPTDIDWAFLEWAAETMFETNSDSDLLYRELVEGYAQDIKQKLKMAEDTNQDAENRYSPTAELTTRLVNEIPKFVRATALLDLLLTDLTDVQLDKMLKKPIVLSPLSTWRTFWMLTSVGPGRNRYNSKNQTVDFGLVPAANGALVPLSTDYLSRIARDRLEIQEVANTNEEQSKWLSRFTDNLKSYMKANKDVSLLFPTKNTDEDFNNTDFEHIIFQHRR